MIFVNGEEIEGCEGLTLAELLTKLKMNPTISVVILDGKAIRRNELDVTPDEAGAEYSILPVVGGG